MISSTKRLALAASLAVGLTAGLTACTAANSAPDPTTAPITETTEPAPEPTTAVGDVLTTEPSHLRLPGDQDTYELADGTFVIISPTEPFPANVIADIQAEAIAHYSLPGNPSSLYASVAHSVTRDTGRSVVIVGPWTNSDTADGPHWTEWCANTSDLPHITFAEHPDLSVTITEAEAWIADQADPGTWELVVLPLPPA